MNTLSRLLDQDWPTFNNFGHLGGELDKFLNAFEQPIQNKVPPLNVSQTDDQLVVSLELPGVAPEAVDVSVLDRVLTISGTFGSGEAQDESAADEQEWLLRERRTHGRFERQVNLPWNVDAEEVKAAYTHGVLNITLPRAAKDKPRKIEISA